MATFTKIYDICLKNRLEAYIIPLIPPEQTAYQHERRGCEEHLFTVKTLCELYGENLIIVLTDFSKAFNSVCNSVIVEALKNLGVNETLLACTFDATRFFVTVDTSSGEISTHARGVPQGGVTSAILFLAALFTLTSQLNSAPLQSPIFVGNVRLNHVLFADDCQILGTNPDDVSLLFAIVQNWSIFYGLPLHVLKCKYLGKIRLHYMPTRE